MHNEQTNRFGERLSNGAVVISTKPGASPHQIVLAHTGSLGGCPWAMWSEYHHPGERPSCGNGHYFKDIADAALHYRDRVS